MKPNNFVPIEILLVEDSAEDALLMTEALNGGKIANNLNVVVNGEEALEYLYQRGRFAKAVRPDIILLDLNLPRKDGREMLAEIKGDPDLKKIPVVVITTSSAEEDILKSYNLHANCYIQKPLGCARGANWSSGSPGHPALTASWVASPSVNFETEEAI